LTNFKTGKQIQEATDGVVRKAFDSLLVFVYHCFDRIVLHGALLSVPVCVPSKWSGPSAQALPRDGTGRLAGGMGFSCGLWSQCSGPAWVGTSATQRARSPNAAGGSSPESWKPRWTGCWKHLGNAANRRLARHLEHEQLWLFAFLHCFGVDATNNTSERAIRGMVIARKVWGGSRTWAGARTHQILASVQRTCWQQGKDA
jgi:hypothetical protein